jgi:hypothetical protein
LATFLHRHQNSTRYGRFCDYHAVVAYRFSDDLAIPGARLMYDSISSEDNINNRGLALLNAQATRLLAWATRTLVRLLRRTKARHFVRGILFVCLPFKMRFRVTKIMLKQ